MRTAYRSLTLDEWFVLNKIAAKTKMDCWFWLSQDKYGIYHVYDLEENKRWCLKTGVKMLFEGIDCQENYNNCYLTDDEDKTFRELLQKLKIEWSL